MGAVDELIFPILTETDVRLPLYLTSVGHWDHQERMARPEGFPDYQWLQVQSGEGELTVGGRRYVVRAGQAMCLYPHEAHSYGPLSKRWELTWAAFGGRLSGELLAQSGIAQSGVYSTTDRELLLSHLRSLIGCAMSGRPFSGIESSKLLYQFLLDLMKNVYVSSPSAEQNYSRLRPVLDYIERNAHRPIAIGELAAEAGVSPQHLCALFRQTMKMRPIEYVNRQRVNRSKELMIRDAGLKMQDIASLVGYESPSYFGSVFKKLEGVSPEQFRRMHRTH